MTKSKINAIIKYIGKQKKYFAKLGKSGLTNKTNLLYYIKGEMIPPREIKKCIDKGFKICYNVFIADTKASKCHIKN